MADEQPRKKAPARLPFDALAGMQPLFDKVRAATEAADKSFGPSVRAIDAHNARMQQIYADIAETRAESDRLAAQAADGFIASHRAKLEREKRALDLSAEILDHQRQLVEMQSALLELQQQQSAEARVDRRIQYVVLIVAVLALAIPTGLASHSLWWGVAAAGAAILGCALIGLVIIGRSQGTQT